MLIYDLDFDFHIKSLCSSKISSQMVIADGSCQRLGNIIGDSRPPVLPPPRDPLFRSRGLHVHNCFLRSPSIFSTFFCTFEGKTPLAADVFTVNPLGTGLPEKTRTDLVLFSNDNDAKFQVHLKIIPKWTQANT